MGNTGFGSANNSRRNSNLQLQPQLRYKIQNPAAFDGLDRSHPFETTIRLSVEVSHHQPPGDSPRFSGESDCRPDRANRRRAGPPIATENAATMETVQWGRSDSRCSGSRGDIVSAYRGPSEPDAHASIALFLARASPATQLTPRRSLPPSSADHDQSSPGIGTWPPLRLDRMEP